MNKLKTIKRQVLLFFILAILLAIAAIIHGVFFDLDFEQIKRLTIGGVIFTLIFVFPLLIILEKIFDINNQKKFNEFEKRIKKLEKK